MVEQLEDNTFFINVLPLFILSLGPVRTVSSESFETSLKATANGYYHCDSTMEITFTDGVKLEVKDLRFQAFRRSESGDFSGGECR